MLINWQSAKYYQPGRYLDSGGQSVEGISAISGSPPILLNPLSRDSLFYQVTKDVFIQLGLMNGNVLPIEFINDDPVTTPPGSKGLAIHKHVNPDSIEFLMYDSASGKWIETLNNHIIFTTTAKTTNYTMTDEDDVIFHSVEGGSRTVTLDLAANTKGRVTRIKRTDSSVNTLTVQTQNSELIDAATSTTIAALGSLVLMSDGTQYWKVG